MEPPERSRFGPGEQGHAGQKVTASVPDRYFLPPGKWGDDRLVRHREESSRLAASLHASRADWRRGISPCAPRCEAGLRSPCSIGFSEEGPRPRALESSAGRRSESSADVPWRASSQRTERAGPEAPRNLPLRPRGWLLREIRARRRN